MSVVRDYGVKGEIWSSCRLEGGVVKPMKTMVAESMEEVEEESDEAATSGQSEENHSRAVRRAYSQQPRK